MQSGANGVVVNFFRKPFQRTQLQSQFLKIQVAAGLAKVRVHASVQSVDEQTSHSCLEGGAFALKRMGANGQIHRSHAPDTRKINPGLRSKALEMVKGFSACIALVMRFACR